MKRIVSLLLALALLTACLTAHAAEGYTTPVNLRPRDNTYSVDYVFAVGGGESITAVTAADSRCLPDWSCTPAEARPSISLASAEPLDRQALAITDAAGASLAHSPRADFRAVVTARNNSAGESSMVLLASYSAGRQLLCGSAATAAHREARGSA